MLYIYLKKVPISWYTLNVHSGQLAAQGGAKIRNRTLSISLTGVAGTQ